jgi:subtilisin family serine protease
MKSTLLRSLFFCLCLGASGRSIAAEDALTPAPSDRALPSATIPDRYIVQVAAGVDPRSVAATHGVAPNFVYQNAIRGFAGTVPPGRLGALRADPRVLHVVPDRPVAAIGKPTSGGGGTGGTTQTVPAGVARIGASGLTITGAGVGVAVVDTGVDLAHGDLAGAIDAFSAFGGSAQDNNGHGTHVAGIIAARNNTQDTVGVAPGATIYAVKVLDASGSGSDSQVMAGLDWVKAHAASVRVVNMSLGRVGSLDDNPAMHNLIVDLHNAGIAVIVAAGNDAKLEVSQQVPSTYPEVIAVASTTATDGTNQSRYNVLIKADTASYFTSDGAYNSQGIGVTISAPGEDHEDVNKAGFIQSVGILSLKLGGGTTRMSGTSMAAPHAAGVAALIYQVAGTSTAEDIRRRLSVGAERQESATSPAPLDSPTSTYSFDGEREGILSAPGALAAPATAPTP